MLGFVLDNWGFIYLFIEFYCKVLNKIDIFFVFKDYVGFCGR